MKKNILYLIVMLVTSANSYSQVTISDWEGTTKTFGGYPEEVHPTVVANPHKDPIGGVNPSDHVMELTSLAGNNYEMAYINPELGSYIDFTRVNGISMKVYSDVPSTGKIRVLLQRKVNGVIDYSYNDYVDAFYVTTGVNIGLMPAVWQELKFNFYFTGAQNNMYNMISIMPDCDNDSRSNSWYVDDIKTDSISPSFSADLISDFNTIGTTRWFNSKAGNDNIFPALSLVSDPLDATNKVIKITTTSDMYEGAVAMLEGKLNFNSKNSISLRVYSTTAGRLCMKLTDSKNDLVNNVAYGYYSAYGQWQEIKFNFYPNNDNNKYDNIAIYTDYEDATAGQDWYFDDVNFIYTSLVNANLIADFDTKYGGFEPKEGAKDCPKPWVSSLAADPTNSNNHVFEIVTDTTLHEGAATILENKIDFSGKNSISVKVYSAAAGRLCLKMSDFRHDSINKPAYGYYSTPGQWQEVKFNFYTTGEDSNKYDLIGIYTDYENSIPGVAWYFDDFNFVYTPPFTADLIADFDSVYGGFEPKQGNPEGGGVVPYVNSMEPDPANPTSGNKVLRIKTTSDLYEGAAYILENKIVFNGKNSISVRVYASYAGSITMKISDFKNEDVYKIAKGYYSTPGQWQVVKFNFYTTDSDSNKYDLLAVYPDYMGTTADQSWYFDDFDFVSTPLVTANLIADFNTVFGGFEPKQGNPEGGGVVPDANSMEPDPANLTSGNKVLRIKTTSDLYEGAAYIFENKIDFTGKNSVSVRVYASYSGPITMKISDFWNEDEYKVANGYYSTPGQWQIIKFNFYTTNSDSVKYDYLAVYPDYMGTTADQSWYLDDFNFVDTPPFTADLIADFDSIYGGFEPKEGDEGAVKPWISSLATDPMNNSNHALQIVTDTTPYEGAATHLESTLDFTDKNSVSVKVYSPVAGKVWLKIYDFDNESNNIPLSANYFTPGQWQELEFNSYATKVRNDTFDAVTIYPDYEGTIPGVNWYFDDFKFKKISSFEDNIISDFDNVTRYFENYANGVEFPVNNPGSDTINNTGKCMKVSTGSDEYDNVKVTLTGEFDFSTYKSNYINVMVYSPVSGKVKIKLTGPNNEEDVRETKTYYTPNHWQELSFDVSDCETDTYNAVTIFPDFGGKGSADWYIDEIKQYHPIDLNIYSDWDDITLPFSGVGNSNVSQVTNPSQSGIDTSANALLITTTSQTDEGAEAMLSNYMDYSVSAIYTAKVYSASAGTVVMKLEGTGVSSEQIGVKYTDPGKWQLLTFDFGLNIATDVYDKLIILPDSGSTSSGAWYIDDLSGPALVPDPIVLNTTYADWETLLPAIETWPEDSPDILTYSIGNNPVVAGINQSANVLLTNTTAATYEGFAFAIPDVFNFSDGTTFTMYVRANENGNVIFKLESLHGVDAVQIEKQYTKAGSWQQQVFTFNENLPSAYSKIAIFPDFGVQRTSQWYFDNIQGPSSIDRVIFLTGEIAENSEDGKVIGVSLIGDTYVSTLTPGNWTVTGLPSGVSIGSITRVNDTLVNVTLSGNSSGQSQADIPLMLTVNKNELSVGESDLSAGMKIIAIGDFSEARQKKVFVHYMPWYNIEAIEDLPAYGKWRHNDDTSKVNYSNKPMIGEYSQMDEDVLEYQFLTMQAAGIDGIIININPSPSNTDEIIRTKSILSKLTSMNHEYNSEGFCLKYIISYDNPYMSPGDYTGIYNELKYVRDSLVNNPAYSACRFDDDKTGYPVLITWSQLGDQGTSYHKAIEDLFNGDVIHLKRDASDFTSGDATFEWINYLQSNTPTTEHHYWGENYFGDFETAMANQHKLYIPADQRIYLTMGAVWPGFDDHNATWSLNRWINRTVDDGETMALTFDRQINYEPGTYGPIKVELPWIQIVTWNDWPEGATIEPATEDTYGYKTLLTTMVKTAEFKGQLTPDNTDSIAVTIPYAIYQARKEGNNDYADCILAQFMAGNYETAISNCSSAYNINLDVPYIQSGSSTLNGAACAKMILDYEGTNPITQQDIQTYGTNNNCSLNIGSDFIDPYGMFQSLNHFELDPDFNYGELTRNTKEEAYRDICHWISNNIPNTPREHMPSVVPVDGGFNDWVVIKGFQSSADPNEQSNYTIYGFYVSDPRNGGIGSNMFIQANTFGYYYQPISSNDTWNGKYVSVNEPPVSSGTVTVEPERALAEPTNNDLRFAIAEYAFNDYKLADNIDITDVLSQGVTRDRVYFVDLDDTANDYYIVTYTRYRNGDCIVAAIINANNGALMLLAYTEPDYGYYYYLDNYTSNTRLKSADITNSKNNNLLYPVKGAVSLIEQTGSKELSFEIMPNPATDFATIRYETNQVGPVSISILDISGRTIKTINTISQGVGGHNYEINLQYLENGVYFVALKSDGKSSVKRLIVNK